MSKESPTPEEVDAILQYQYGACDVNLPDWHTTPSDYRPQVIPDAAVEAALDVYLTKCNYNAEEIVRLVLEVAAPHMAAQALADAVDAFPLETISAPDNAVVWLMRRAEQLRPAP